MFRCMIIMLPSIELSGNVSNYRVARKHAPQSVGHKDPEEPHANYRRPDHDEGELDLCSIAAIFPNRRR